MAHQWTEHDKGPCITQESDSEISIEPFSEKVARSQMSSSCYRTYGANTICFYLQATL